MTGVGVARTKSWLVVLLTIMGVACTGGADGAHDTSVRDAGTTDPGTSPWDAGADSAPELIDASPDATPAPEAFAFVKAPWLLNIKATSVDVRWQSDVTLTAPTVVLTCEGADPLRVTGSSGPMDMTTGGLPTAPPQGALNHVHVEGLPAGTACSWLVPEAGDSREGSFRTAPGPEGSAHLVLYGDTRTNHDDHAMVVDAIAAEDPDLLIHTGDMVDMSVEAAWQTFFDLLEPALKHAPLVPVIGNHESDVLRAWYLGWFLPPMGFEDGTNTSFDYGPARFIVINVLRDPSRPGFLDWLRAELQAAQARPFRFVLLHHPLHTFSNHAPWEQGREVVEPLLQEYGVTAVFSGHNHCYERFEVGGVMHVTLGGGGAPLYGISQHTVPEEEGTLKAEGKFFHYLALDLSPSSAHATVVRVTPDGNEVFEAFDLAPKVP